MATDKVPCSTCNDGWCTECHNTGIGQTGDPSSKCPYCPVLPCSFCTPDLLAHLKYRPSEYWERRCRFGAAEAWPVIDSLRKSHALLEEFVKVLQDGNAFLEVPGAEELLERYDAMVAEGEREGDE